MAVETVSFGISLWKCGISGISDFNFPVSSTNPTWPDLWLVYVVFVRSVYVNVMA